MCAVEVIVSPPSCIWSERTATATTTQRTTTLSGASGCVVAGPMPRFCAQGSSWRAVDWVWRNGWSRSGQIYLRCQSRLGISYRCFEVGGGLAPLGIASDGSIWKKKTCYQWVSPGGDLGAGQGHFHQYHRWLRRIRRVPLQSRPIPGVGRLGACPAPRASCVNGPG